MGVSRDWLVQGTNQERDRSNFDAWWSALFDRSVLFDLSPEFVSETQTELAHVSRVTTMGRIGQCPLPTRSTSRWPAS